MRTMTDLHRYLGFDGKESRPRGKLITGICNLAFALLAVTGLYLWMPRSWSWRAVSPSSGSAKTLQRKPASLTGTTSSACGPPLY